MNHYDLRPGDPLLHGLSIGHVTSYLRANGWQRILKERGNVVVCQEGPVAGDHEPLIVVLPQRDDYADAAQRLAEAVNLLAAVEGRPATDTVAAIRHQDSDIFRLRFPTGDPSLDVGVKVVAWLQDLMSYAACAEQNPQRYFAKKLKVGSEFVQHCRFGHTFAGSFGFSVISPLPQPAAQLDFAQYEQLPRPFERRVMERMATGLASVHEAELDGSAAIIVDRCLTGLNANMCEVLLDIAGLAGNQETEYAVNWAAEWHVPPAFRQTRALTIKPSLIDYLQSATRQLRSPDESRTITVRGRVVQLRSESDPTEDEDTDAAEHVVTIAGVDEAGSAPLRVHVALSTADYASACDAHKLGQEFGLQGILEKKGKFWWLMHGARCP